ncbi:pilus assembly protein [Dyella choica]|uniref:Pilus assembly protein PilY n=1 Tax=Dyella choica TaxID=1927959 RepID=A0A432M4B0_9GAMM|nr:PilC/PilY family type IV pilus protein [Dyella choica]RUL74049.1 pilus assembly protein PilY [Dyella choica]
MNKTSPWRRIFGHTLGRLLSTVLVVWMVGVANAPAMAATTVPTVDQQPLTLQPTIPPNIMVMIDDSGSMVWDFMPDMCYLYGVTCTGTYNGTNPNNGQGVDYFQSANNDALIDASNNGLYYNPKVTYLAPVKSDGTYYPNYPLTGANITSVPLDGFNTGNGNADLTQYTSYDVTGEAENGNYPLYYSTSVTSSTASTYSGSAASNNACSNIYSSTPNSFGGYTYSKGNCSFKYYPTYNYFQYSTGPAAGPYTKFYVSPGGKGCGAISNCYSDSDTSGAVAPVGVNAGLNIANWFAYYHTRIQMAKSGLMTAFSTVSSSFRVGFGSIDGGCNGDASNVPNSASSPVYQYTDTYDCGNGGSVTNTVASVQPFGSTQKSAFWTWVSALSPSGGTPLRVALDEMGRYYETAQPWKTMSSDPSSVSPNTLIACRQAYTILTTDGFWNESNSSFSNTLPAPGAPLAAGPPGNADGSNGPTNNGPNAQTYTYKPVAPYTDGNSNTLADVAMKYWENDLQPTMAAEVPTNSADPAFWQHMTTFTMGLGFTPVGINPSGTTVQQIFNWVSGTGPAISNFSWPTPSRNSLYNIADLAHAAVNGHGGFYSATSPETFASGLTDALMRAAERVGTGASLAANSTQLNNGTVAYQANYYTAKWKGDLKSLPIDVTSGAVSTTPTWTAATVLNSSATSSGSVSTYPNRKIVTYNPTAAAGSQFVSFINSGSAAPTLSSAELTALGSTTTAQMNMVNYLRGDNTLEQKNSGNFRNRDTPLGDIVDSQPVFSGAPNTNEYENQTFTGTDSFVAWAAGTTDSNGNEVPSAAAQRTPLVFAAANDGMLHAFNANTGAEVYAYLPGAVITASLANLSDPNYGATSTVPHQYYNDGELTIADAYLPSLTQINGSSWHTILVGTTGRGLAKAVYALDITDPTNIKPLWERSTGDGQTNSGYIGQMVGKPVIAKVQDAGTVTDWQVLIGNGYNSTKGSAALLEFELDNGTLSVHSAGAGGNTSSTGSGLAAPVAWMDNPGNGISMEAYAGDLLGNVWSFPLDNVTTVGHGSGATTSYVADLTSAGSLIFSTPLDASSNPQPITAGMLAGKDSVTGNVWLFFGTGQYLSSGDLPNKQVESWYGVIAQTSDGSIPALPATQSQLVQRSIIYEQDGNPSATPPTLGARVVSTAAVGDMSGRRGWYMNLEQPTLDSNGNVTGYNAQGERMVTPNQFQGNLLLGITRIPVVTDVCAPSGSGWVMAVNPFTGDNPTAAFFTGNGSGGMVTVGGKSVPVAGVGFSSLPNNPIFVGSDMLMSFDNGNTSNLMTSGSTGGVQRVSWQEVVNQ